MEQLEVFRRYVAVADWAWSVVSSWQPLARDTTGRQLVRAIDSVGANLVEGDGRQGTADSIHFFIIARASAREARYWIDRAVARTVISGDEGIAKVREIEAATQLLNNLIAYRRGASSAPSVREDIFVYDAPGCSSDDTESDAT